MKKDDDFVETMSETARSIVEDCIDVLKYVDYDSTEWEFAMNLIKSSKEYLKKKKV